VVRLSDRVAAAVGRRLDRRGFLARAALGGTALAVAPVAYSLRPGDAYSAICRCNGVRCQCGSTCCDGYTEFCCTVFGSNRCPPGSVIAGWWKADGSPFCGGGPRYYMDCNAPCGDCGCGGSGLCSGGCSGTGCGCAFGDCDHRRIGCVQFRYGQCNQHVACVGPITCRLVTCVPPWEIEPTCTTTVAVDQGTRLHNAPCLQGGRGSIDLIDVDRHRVRVSGWAVDSDSAVSLTVQCWVDGSLVVEVPGNLERPDLAPVFPGLGTAHGFDAAFDLSPGFHTVSVQAFAPDAAIDRFDVGTRVIGIGVPFGAVDVVGQVPGGVRVAGWVIDPDADVPPPVHLYVDDKLTLDVVADLPRPDVAAVYSRAGVAHGFDVVVPVGPGDHRVCAYAIDTNGDRPGDGVLNRLLACRSVTVSTRAIGNVDVAETAPGGIRVAGWALDPETAEPLAIHVYIDGALAGVTRADVDRPDIAALAPAWGPARGYDVVVPAIPGRREVCVYAIDAGSGGAANPSLGCRSLAVSSAPFGRLEVVQRDGDAVRVRGWAIDPATGDPIDVHVQVDGVTVATARADARRPDVAATYRSYGADHGFEIVAPAPAPFGRRQVCVFAIGTAAGNNSMFGCDFA
jgi:hypothetical protein